MYFDSLMEYETGIYVVCSDKSLLDTINRMLKRQGIIGVTDTAGRTHYLVDARKSPGHAARQIADFINSNALSAEQIEINSDERSRNSNSNKFIRIVATETLKGYGFDLSLIGTKAILVLIKILIKKENLSSMCAKEMFMMAADVLGQTYTQIERDIRYSIKKSQYNQYGTKTSHVVRCLVEEVRGRIYIGAFNTQSDVKENRE